MTRPPLELRLEGVSCCPGRDDGYGSGERSPKGRGIRCDTAAHAAHAGFPGRLSPDTDDQWRLRVLSMGPREIEKEHWASTAVELLLDLCFVMASRLGAPATDRGRHDAGT